MTSKQIQPLRISYITACEVLDLSREGLRKLIKKDKTFPRPIKEGSHKQAPVFFDYQEMMDWHESKKSGRVARKQQKTIVWGEFDDGTDDRDLFCAGIPKNITVLMTGCAA